jgi:hypothetical protein
MTTRRAALWLSAAGIAIALGGCTAIRRNEATYEGTLLKAAGFDVEPGDQTAHAPEMRTVPPLEMISRTKDGAVEYRFADPYVCRCLYVGDAHAYRQYRSLLSDDVLRAVVSTPSL